MIPGPRAGSASPGFAVRCTTLDLWGVHAAPRPVRWGVHSSGGGILSRATRHDAKRVRGQQG
eukprot:10382511-Alexandrium_andersonii.AAC.1